VATLPTKSFYLGNRDALNTDVSDRLTNVVELEGLDDRGDHFHESVLLL